VTHVGAFVSRSGTATPTTLRSLTAAVARRTLRGSPSAWSGRGFFVCCDGNSRGTNSAKNLQKCYEMVRQTSVNPLISLVGAPRFELGTPSPPDCHRPLILLGDGVEPFDPRVVVCTTSLILLTSVPNAARSDSGHSSFSSKRHVVLPPGVTGNGHRTFEPNRHGMENSGHHAPYADLPMPVTREPATHGRAELRRP
jgi:hypothetical protein